jgi:hypothetical protein
LEITFDCIAVRTPGKLKVDIMTKRILSLSSLALTLNLFLSCGEQTPADPVTHGLEVTKRVQRKTTDLISQGAEALSTEAIRELVLGKTLRITDLRTGEKYDVFFGEDGTRTVLSTVSLATAAGTGQATSTFEVRDGQLLTIMPDGSGFSSKIFRLGDRHFGARDDEEGYANFEILGVISGRVTVASLLTQGAEPLDTKELTNLLVGKTITVRHLVTGEIFEISYSKEGIRTLAPTSEHEERIETNYQIRDGRLEIQDSETQFWAQIFKLDNQIFGARSIEDGFISYEILSSRPNSH